MPILVFATFSLDLALIVGFAVYGVAEYRKTGKAQPFLLISAAALVAGRLLQFLQ